MLAKDELSERRAVSPHGNRVSHMGLKDVSADWAQSGFYCDGAVYLLGGAIGDDMGTPVPGGIFLFHGDDGEWSMCFAPTNEWDAEAWLEGYDCLETEPCEHFWSLIAASHSPNAEIIAAAMSLLNS